MTLDELIAAAEAAPRGPRTGAVFAVDGTVIAGSLPDVSGQDELERLGETLFARRIAGMVYPEMRALIAAHRRRGHTVVLVSGADRHLLQPLARDLEVDHVRPGAGVELRRGFAYASSDADAELLNAAGHPCAVNPRPALAALAKDRGWPSIRLSSRGRPGVREVLRTGAAIGALSGAAALGLGVGLVNGRRRDASNLAASLGGDLALALAGVQLTITGEERLWSHRPAVFIFNHQSSFDIPIVASLVRRDMTGVAKKEAARDPRFALVGYLADVVYVDRGNTAQAKEALAPVVERLRSGISMAIAPEGTRTPTPRLRPFKKGAFHIAMQAGVPIVPIVIRNAGDVMWRNSFFVRPGRVDVAVLPPVSTEGWTVDRLDERVAEMERRFSETLESWPAARPSAAR